MFSLSMLGEVTYLWLEFLSEEKFISFSRQNINRSNSSEFLSERKQMIMEILLEKQHTSPWVKKLLTYFKHNNQNRAIIQETYQKSTLWNACGKLLSVCQLVILGLRKSALQKSCTARQQSVVPFGQKGRRGNWVRINSERSIPFFMHIRFHKIPFHTT